MKESYYFQHDYNARNDTKIQNLMCGMGCNGIGIYWCIVEMLYEQDGKLSMCDCKSIAFALHVDEQDVNKVVNDYDLFENDGTFFWSDSVNRRLDKRSEIAEKRKNAAVNRWKSSREMQMQSNCNAKQEICNAIKEKERKEKKSNNESNKLDSPETIVPDNDEKVDYKKIVDLYHGICKSFPKLLKLSDARKQKIRIRFVDEMQCDYSLLESLFRAMEESKFLRGDNRNGWKATFDWLFENSKNWVKVAEGNYKDKPDSSRASKKVNDIWK